MGLLTPRFLPQANLSQLQHNFPCCHECPPMSLGSEEGAVGSHPPQGPQLAGSQDPSEEHTVLGGWQGTLKARHGARHSQCLVGQ